MTIEQIIQSLESVQTVLDAIERTDSWKALSEDLETTQDMELAQAYVCEIIRALKSGTAK